MTGDEPGSVRGDEGTGAGTSDEDGEETRIEQLDRRTIDRIAAGEVVERPASAVKELLENAIDADASRVNVAVESGGIDGISVTDDGTGMSEAGVRKAIEKHTTSKIRDIDDLEGGVASLGFRGEALAAIAAVSEVTIRTKPRGTSRGTELVVRGGEVESVSPTGCPAGTVVEVSDLFYNVPARKKYLKQAATEFAHVNRVVTGYALANPDVAVTLEHGARETFSTSGSGSLREAVLSTYGREVARAMIPLDADEEDGGDGGGRNESDEDWRNDGDDESDDAESPIEAIGGLVSDPETTRANASYVTTIVNGRYVTATVLREAIVDAYGSQLAPDRYPFAVLDVRVAPETLDVNVHPRKMEVRFADERAIKERVEARVERALLREGLVRSGAPRGRSAPTQTRIEPTSPSGDPEAGERRASKGPRAPEPRERDATNRDGSQEGGTGSESETGAAVEGSDDPESGSRGSDRDPSGDDDRGSSATTGTRGETRGTGTNEGSNGEPRATGDEPTGRGGNEENERRSGPSRGDAGEASDSEGADPVEQRGRDPDPVAGVNQSIETESESEREREDTSKAGDAWTAVDLDGVVDPHTHIDERAARPSGTARFDASEQRTLSGEPMDTSREFDRLPSLRVLGQCNGTYVVCETDDGLVLIDQHAADERITYERLRERLPRGEAQTLADPVEIELTAGEAALFESHVDTLAGLGFYASWADGAADEGEPGDPGEKGDDDGATGRDGEDGSREERRTVAVRTVPAAIADPDPALLRDVLSAFVSADRPGETIDAAADALLADLACYPSITANTSLSAGSMVDLLAELDACENPYACPHGRPVVIEFSSREIEARFERDYPGHAGRRSK